MERVTSEVLATMDLKSGVRKTSAVEHVYKAIGELGVGDGLVIPLTEWPNKNKPAQSGFPKEIRTLNRKYRVRTKVDGSAFVVIRTA